MPSSGVFKAFKEKMMVRKQWFKCSFFCVKIFTDREKGKCLGKMGDRRKGKALCSWARDTGGHRKVEGGAEGHDGPDVGESPGAWGEGRPHPRGQNPDGALSETQHRGMGTSLQKSKRVVLGSNYISRCISSATNRAKGSLGFPVGRGCQC